MKAILPRAAALVLLGVALVAAATHDDGAATASDEFPSTTVTFVNDTGQVADGIHISAYPIPSFEILSDAPGCESPHFEFSGTWPHGAVTVYWPTKCVDPGESVEVRITMDCTPCSPPGVGEHTWLLDAASEWKSVPWGDMDCDGEITSRDAQATLRFVLYQPLLSVADGCPVLGTTARLWSYHSAQRWGDLTCDNEIESLESWAILRWVLSPPDVSTPDGCPELGEVFPVR